MYYAFYAQEWNGKGELSGLEAKSHLVTDWENKRALRKVRGPSGTLDVRFQKHLCL